MKNISCPHCKQNIKDIIYQSEVSTLDMNVVKCSYCKHIYAWVNEEINEVDLYESEAYKLDDQRTSIFFKIQKFEYVKVLKNIKAFINKQTGAELSILDFGSGKGHFLHFASRLGFKPYGVETAVERAAFAKEKYNLEISNEYYSGKGKINEMQYDAITLIHVLEHLSEPKLLLEGLFNENLKEKGVLVVEVPNFNSWQSSLGGERWLHLDLPRHLNHYSDKYLSDFLQELNGDILKKEFFSFHHGIIGMVQSLMSLFGYKRSLIVDLKFNKTAGIVTVVLLLILPALLLESVASLMGKGGVIRIYIKRSKYKHQ